MTQTLKLNNSIKSILDYFQIKYYEHVDRFSFPCPIHGGDNPTGVSIYKNTGCWCCFTHGCEQIHGKSTLAFVRALMEKREGRPVSFKEALKFCKNNKLDECVLEKEEGISKELANQFSIFTEQDKVKHKLVKPEWYNTNVVVPSKYFLARGFSKEILENYNVGYCDDRYNQLYRRAVVPLYDEEGKNIVGITGRTLSPKCRFCNQHHPAGSQCVNYSPKWTILKGTKKGKILYNLHNAKEHIKETGSVIIVEGCPCVWRLEESGIHIGISILGVSLNDYHVNILNGLGVRNIFSATDNDEAGQEAFEKMEENYGDYFNFYRIELPEKDFGDMKTEEVKDLWRKYEKHSNY